MAQIIFLCVLLPVLVPQEDDGILFPLCKMTKNNFNEQKARRHRIILSLLAQWRIIFCHLGGVPALATGMGIGIGTRTLKFFIHELFSFPEKFLDFNFGFQFSINFFRK